MNTKLPLLPTSVVGSYGSPSWLLTALGEIEAGRYGETDRSETFDDAVRLAMLDQERAGVDIISDGELRRSGFFHGFYPRFAGLDPLPPRRRVGLPSYDTQERWRVRERLGVPRGLGIVEEFTFARAHTSKPLKVACPGPLTFTILLELNDVYPHHFAAAEEIAPAVNAELRALVAAGADFIQIDEPSFVTMPGELTEWVRLFNRVVEGVQAKIALHVCFGNLGSRPRGKRTWRRIFPALLEARVDQFVLEFANREMSEIELWKEWGSDKELGAGLVDVKSCYIERPEDVAERIRQALRYVAPEKLTVNPDCGFLAMPRWIAYRKLVAMVQGTRLVRRELTGREE
ncbi:MAG: methionine synthase [Candidatus Tectomicrobia bacterium]|nr:methionine synthase [Candidatus Tectomicrobia bacterium]